MRIPLFFSKVCPSTRTRTLRAFLWTVVLLATIFMPICPLLAAQSQGATVQARVVFLPVTVQVDGAPSHLSGGLASVLASRVATRARITAITQGSSTQQMQEALHKADFSSFNRLLAETNADYLVLSTFGPSNAQYELASYVFSRGSGAAPQKVSRFLSNADDPLPAADELASDISALISGKGTITQTGSAARQDGASPFSSAHPERAYRENMLAQSVAGLERAQGGFKLVESLRGRPLPIELLDLNVGDVDGDGVQELVLLGNKILQLYRYEEGRFVQKIAQDLPGHLNYLSVTLADANGNGVPELYIGASNGALAASSIWEWQNGRLVRLAENIPYYLHAVSLAKGETMLLGQTPPPKEASGGTIHLMRYEEGTLQPSGNTLPLPEGYNVYDVAPADLDGDGTLEIVAINNKNRLQVFSSSGTLLWTSADEYGASRNFYGTVSSAAAAVQQPSYLHTRIVTTDIDQDGITDVLVGKNRAKTVPYLPNIRYFDGSSLAGLKWEERGLRVLWETQRISGYVAGYQLLPVQGEESRLELFFAETENTYPFLFWSTPTTSIHRFVLAVEGGTH